MITDIHHQSAIIWLFEDSAGNIANIERKEKMPVQIKYVLIMALSLIITSAATAKPSVHVKKYQENAHLEHPPEDSNYGTSEVGRVDGVAYFILYDDNANGTAFFLGGISNNPDDFDSFDAEEYIGDYWIVKCSIDEMTDTGGCSIERSPLTVNRSKNKTFPHTKRSPLLVSIAKESLMLFFGPIADRKNMYDLQRGLLVRIDAHKAHSAERIKFPNGPELLTFTQEQTKLIVEQMTSGEEIKIRYYRLSDGKQVDQSLPLHGFKQALDFAKWWAYKNQF